MSRSIGYLHIMPRERLLSFSAYNLIYSHLASYRVNNVYRNGAELTQASSIANVGVDGDYFYSDSTLYIDDISGFIVAEYIMLFSTKTNVAPIDLESGIELSYEGLISSDVTSSFELGDRDQNGNALEGKTRVSLINTHGYFDDIIERFTWSNAKMKTFAMVDGVKHSLFDGFVSGQSFSSSVVSFNGKNFIDKLRTSVPLGLFSTGIEQIDERYKRRVYGRVANLSTTSTDPIIDGYSIAGLFSGTGGNNLITVSSGDVLNDIYQGDELTINEVTYSVERVTSSTSITVSSDISATFTNKSGSIKPARSLGKKNRVQQIAGHKLYAKATTVAYDSAAFTRITVVDSSNLFEGDIIHINGVEATIRRVSINNKITLLAQIGFLFTAGMTVTKPAVQAIRFNELELNIEDSILTNTTESYLTLSDFAEFNATKVRNISGSFTLTNGSRVISGPVQESLRAGDWIRPETTSTWIQVNYRDSEDTTIGLCSSFTGSSGTYQLDAKYVDYIEDIDGVQVDCSGKEDESGNWIITGAQTVRDLILEQGLTVNEASFTQASIDNDMLVSFMLPLEIGSTPGEARNVIGFINKSIFGNLYPNNDLEISYSILNQDRIEDGEITDHDIIGNTQQISDKNILTRVDASYRFQDKDPYLKEPTSIVASSSNSDTEYMIGTTRQTEINVYLYNEDDARMISQRYLLLREFKESMINVTAQGFLTSQINDNIYYKFDRMTTGYRNNRLGKVVAISKGAYATSLRLDDLGSTLTRVGAVTDLELDYANASDTQKDYIGFTTDDDEMISNDSETYKFNLIG